MSSEVDKQEVRNAVDQSQRELRTRFDFKGTEAEIFLDDNGVLISAPEEFQLGQLEDIFKDKLVARGVDIRYLVPGSIYGLRKAKKQLFEMRQGIDRDSGKAIVKIVKDSKLKVQTQINGEKIRVTGKKRDELQKVIGVVKGGDLELPIHFDNFRD